MEFRPLSNIHIVARVHDKRLENLEKGKAYVSYLIDVNSDEEIRSLFTKVFWNKQQANFSISLEISDNAKPTSEWNSFLSLILCHPSYFKSNNRCVIGLCGICDNPKKQNGFISNLNSFLAEQGIVKTVFFHTDSHEMKSNSGFVLFDEKISDTDFPDWYLSNLKHSSINLNIVAHFGSDSIFDRIDTLCRGTEKELKENHKIIYENLLWSRKKGERLQDLEVLIEDMAEDISSKKMYLDYLLGKETDGVRLNEIMQIKKFYHNEYEVLPLWYKRFGHIIKVMTGKRTFRSLLDDKNKRS